MISDKHPAMPTYVITAPPSSMTCKTTRGSLNAKAYTISSLQMVCVERMEHEKREQLIFPASLLFRTHCQAAGGSSGILRSELTCDQAPGSSGDALCQFTAHLSYFHTNEN